MSSQLSEPHLNPPPSQTPSLGLFPLGTRMDLPLADRVKTKSNHLPKIIVNALNKLTSHHDNFPAVSTIAQLKKSFSSFHNQKPREMFHERTV